MQRSEACSKTDVLLRVDFLLSKKKVKVSRNRPSVAQRVPGVLGSQIS